MFTLLDKTEFESSTRKLPNGYYEVDGISYFVHNGEACKKGIDKIEVLMSKLEDGEVDEYDLEGNFRSWVYKFEIPESIVVNGTSYGKTIITVDKKTHEFYRYVKHDYRMSRGFYVKSIPN